MTAGGLPAGAFGRAGDLEPGLFAWAVAVEHLRVLLVVEPSYRMDSPPGVHLAVTARPVDADEVLAANGWTARAWLPRSWVASPASTLSGTAGPSRERPGGGGRRVSPFKRSSCTTPLTSTWRAARSPSMLVARELQHLAARADPSTRSPHSALTGGRSGHPPLRRR